MIAHNRIDDMGGGFGPAEGVMLTIFIGITLPLLTHTNGLLDKMTEIPDVPFTLCLVWELRATCNMLINPT